MVVWNSKQTQLEAATVAVSFHALRDLAAPVRLTSFLLSSISLQKVLPTNCPVPTTLDFFPLVTKTLTILYSHFRFRAARTDGHAYRILSGLVQVLFNTNPRAEKNHTIPQDPYLSLQFGSSTNEVKTLKESWSCYSS